ncbi:hypothetical protein SASPL_122506 [Salvia splendens]|uniref:Uncharacterized protein n=1 Tax=Salvia splendens TaxID=180675 RepID=A0A8X8XM89_SALSN|nr:hypothetical protein SASPL_122506 [Salvia splendens]
MARNELPPGRNTNPNNNSTSPATTKAKTKNSPKTIAKSSNGSRNRITEAANGDASSEDTEVSVVPSSSVESENDSRASIHRRHIDSLATESSEAEDDGVEQRSSSNEEEEEEEKEVEEEEEEGEEEEEEENEEKKPNSVNRKGKRDNAKSKGKKRSRKEEDESEAEEKGENAQYVFPMKRINRIAKVENPDRKFFQEAVFVINRASVGIPEYEMWIKMQILLRYVFDVVCRFVIGAVYMSIVVKTLVKEQNARVIAVSSVVLLSLIATDLILRKKKLNLLQEKFLQVFCKEAYACAFLEKKKQIAYNHLSSVVSKRKRFQFISDFVPEKTKAKDALALGEEAEMTKAKEK